MKFIRSVLFACHGIAWCRQQLNFRLHLLAMLVAIAAGFYLKINGTEWIFVCLCCTLVLAMEMVNTAIEKICDLVTIEIHPLIKIIKDVSAGAVLICALGSVFTAAIIFIPKIIIQIKLFSF